VIASTDNAIRMSQPSRAGQLLSRSSHPYAIIGAGKQPRHLHSRRRYPPESVTTHGRSTLDPLRVATLHIKKSWC
jgi:hypothetical protein